MKERAVTSQRGLFSNTLLVGTMFAVSAAAGLLRNMVIGRQFGIGIELDVYYAAFKVPDLLFTIVAGGALATAFIPVFTGCLARGDREGAWRLASAITNLVELTMGVFALLAGLGAHWLVRYVIAPGFTPEAQAQTVTIMRLVLVSTLLFGVSAVQSSVLHGFKHFFLPAVAPVMYPVGVTAGALLLAPRWGVRGLAMGAILGAFLHLSVKVPGLIRHGFRWWPVLDIGSVAVRRVLVLMGPRILDLGVFHLTLLATTNLASRLAPGSVSALEWGWSAMQLPETVIGTAFGLVAFPTLAELAAKGDIENLRHTLGSTLRVVLVLTVPAAATLIVLGRPLLQVLYQHGAFNAAHTEAVFVALRFFALGLVGHSCLELVARTFFARQDMVTPLLVAMGSAVLNVGLGLALMGPLAHGGLALANSLAVSLEVITLMAILRQRIGGVEGLETLRALGMALVAAVPFVLVVIALEVLGLQSGMGTLPTLVFAGMGGVLVYFLTGLLLGLTPLRQLQTLVGGLVLNRLRAHVPHA